MSGTLIDTNILIDFIRDRDQALDFLRTVGARPAISVVTIMELTTGAKSRREEDRISKLEQRLHVLNVTPDVARIAGEHVKHYRASHGLDDLDAIIAATAEHHGLKLATLNVKHFPMFARLKPAY